MCWHRVRAVDRRSAVTARGTTVSTTPNTKSSSPLRSGVSFYPNPAGVCYSKRETTDKGRGPQRGGPDITRPLFQQMMERPREWRSLSRSWLKSPRSEILPLHRLVARASRRGEPKRPGETPGPLGSHPLPQRLQLMTSNAPARRRPSAPRLPAAPSNPWPSASICGFNCSP